MFRAHIQKLTVMCDHHDDTSFASFVQKTRCNDVRVVLIDIARRFVGQYDVRGPGQSAGDGGPLLLSNAKLSRPVLQSVFDVKTFGQRLNGGGDLPSPTTQDEPQFYIVEDCEIRDKKKPLEHETDALLSITIPARGTPSIDIIIFKQSIPFVRREHPPEHQEQRTLAASTGTVHDEEIAGLYDTTHPIRRLNLPSPF
jgi:hypothetical protein